MCPYTEAVLCCQRFLNGVCCAVCALKTHKAKLLDQTKPEHLVLVPTKICLYCLKQKLMFHLFTKCFLFIMSLRCLMK